jgi:hypothetical protein
VVALSGPEVGQKLSGGKSAIIAAEIDGWIKLVRIFVEFSFSLGGMLA